MNIITRKIVQMVAKDKFAAVLKALHLQGYRSQILGALYLAVTFGQWFNLFPDPDLPKFIKGLILGLMSYTMADKIRRNGPLGPNTPTRPQ